MGRRAAGLLAASLAGLGGGAISCVVPDQPTPAGEVVDSMAASSIESAQSRVTKKVIGMQGVTGTALGLCGGKPCIKIYLESDDPRLRSRLPKSEAGFPVEVEVTGKIMRR